MLVEVVEPVESVGSAGSVEDVEVGMGCPLTDISQRHQMILIKGNIEQQIESHS